MRKSRIFIFCLFIGTLTGGFLFSLFTPQKEYSAAENRMLEQRPEFYLEDVLSGDFQESYETYLNDQFFWRDRWVDVAVGFEKALGKQDVNGIYLGTDGYLLEKYTDGDFDEQQTEDNIWILSDFLNMMTEVYGAEHVDALFVPGKAAALPTKLPGNAGAFDEQEIIAALAENLDKPEVLLDLTETMQTHQEAYIYYRTDHHWTTLGAYYAYEAWCVGKGIQPTSLSDYKTEVVTEDFYGTSYNKCHQKVAADTVTLFHGTAEEQLTVDWNDGERQSDSWYCMDSLTDSDKYRVFFDGNTAKIMVETGADNGKTLLLLKDSYANCMVPFLAEQYSRIIMIDLRYTSDLIADVLAANEEITDVMVLFNIEKFLQNDSMDLCILEY